MYVTTVFFWIDWLEQCFDTPSLTILPCIHSASIGQAMVQKDITILLLLSTAGSGGVFRLSIPSWKKKGEKAGLDLNRSFLNCTAQAPWKALAVAHGACRIV